MCPVGLKLWVRDRQQTYIAWQVETACACNAGLWIAGHNKNIRSKAILSNAGYNQQDETFLSLFISVRCSTVFRRFFRPSSGAQNCTYSVRCLFVRPKPNTVCAVLSSWWWTEKPLETCRASYRNKYIEKCHISLVVLCECLSGPMNVKFTEQPFGNEETIKGKKSVGQIINDFYAFYSCVLKSNTLSSVVPSMGR